MAFYYVIFPLIFFMISFYLAKKDFLLVVAFIFLLNIFLRIILFKTIPDVGFASGTFINITIVLIFIYYTVRYSLFNRERFLLYIGSILLFLLYTSLLSLYREFSTTDYLYFVRNFLFNFLLLIIFFSVSVKKQKYDTKYYIYLIVALTIFQSSLILFQYFNPAVADYFTIVEYSRFGETISRVTGTLLEQRTVRGTFNSMQGVSGFLMINIIFVVTLKWFNLIKLNNRIYIVLLLSLVAMAFVGVRAPFIGLFIGLFVLVWYKSKFVSLLIAFTSVFLVPFLMNLLQSLIVEATTHSGPIRASFENPLTRLTGAFVLFDPVLVYRTSIGRTLILFDQYLFRNPLFGFGPGIIFTDYSITDAFSALLLVEFGLIGVTILLFPYIYTMLKMKKELLPNYYIAGIIIFITIMSQSITNEGIWSWSMNIHFFFCIMILYRINYDYIHNS